MIAWFRPAAALAAIVVAALASRAESPAGKPPNGESTRLVVVDVDGGAEKVVELPGRLAAPGWSGDGRSLVLNGDGKLWRTTVEEGRLQPVAINGAGWIDVNHGESPDGKTLAFSANGTIFRAATSGAGSAARIAPGYFHAWSPDGRRIAFAANRGGGGGVDVFSIGLDGGGEKRLTTAAALDDAPQYSPDGRWLYFLSDRDGGRDLWRMPVDGGDARAERITRDPGVEVAPRPSPDGRWLYYLVHPPGTPTNAVDRDARLMRMPIRSGKPDPAAAEQVARFVGGHGSIGSRAFSPDGKKFAHVARATSPPSIRIVLFTPSDLRPPAIAADRLTQTAETAERFLFSEMKRWKRPPAVERLFERGADGNVVFQHVRGDRPSSDRSYQSPDCRTEAVRKAAASLGIEPDGQIWWVFLYLGDRPRRFGDWRGSGTSRDGGSAIVNLDTLPGEIRPNEDPASGFNGKVFVKGMIHELGHALGLPHLGPDPSLGRGNSLMGPNNDVYAARRLPKPDRCYLTEASAAMLWKHPVFSGRADERSLQPTVKLVDYKPSHDRAADKIVLEGRLSADMPATDVVVIDDRGVPRDEYWRRAHVARLSSDGSFRVEIPRPARSSGEFRILFCFENGMPTGDGRGFGDSSGIRKTYRYLGGGYRFGE